MHDRAGFLYLLVVWYGSLYLHFSCMYLVLHPVHCFEWAALFSILGASAIIINYLADKQRLRVRISEGHCKIWGKTQLLYWPVIQPLKAKGENRYCLLLVGGVLLDIFTIFLSLQARFFGLFPRFLHTFRPIFTFAS